MERFVPLRNQRPFTTLAFTMDAPLILLTDVKKHFRVLNRRPGLGGAFLDLFSRKIVGWQVYEEESSVLASGIVRDICQREGVPRHQLTLHSDNGGPMKGATMLATLHGLGVRPSFSRPAVSNDNPYSESLFKTLKYRPDSPLKPFADVAAAR